MKICRKCGSSKSPDEFYRNRNRSDGYQNYCKDCQRAYARAHQAGPYRERSLKLQKERMQSGRHYANKFGISLERYWELINTGCAICGATSSGRKRLSIDHDHACCDRDGSCGNCVRGALCRTCNAALGFLRDDPALIGRVIDYLKARA